MRPGTYFTMTKFQILKFVWKEGELKHYHKVRYMLAQGFYKRGEVGDLERACFKSSFSSFMINMWEIDGPAKRTRYYLSYICS